MKNNSRKNHKIRLEAYDLLIKLKERNVSRLETINLIHNKYKLSINTLYDWFRKKHSPHGRKGKIKEIPELYYVLGSLLGDGCAYQWKITSNFVILVGNYSFTKKYARRLSKSTNKKSIHYVDRTKNIWFVRINNFKLFSLLKNSKLDSKYLFNQIKTKSRKSKLYFIEGFFDAEGCVKIVKEKNRKTPKICLDITNTNKELLDIIQNLLFNTLKIKSNYSIQKSNIKTNRKTVYHLRIYKKEYVNSFFSQIKTIKLYKEKKKYLKNWLSNGK